MQTLLLAHLALTSVLLVLLTAVVVLQAGARAARRTVTTVRPSDSAAPALQARSA